jgi:putative tricarboxylic transport membrane protein
MAPREAASAGVLALVALVGLVGAARLDVGGLTRPGPGFFPLVLSLGLLAVSVVLFAGAARARSPGAGNRPARLGARPARLAATLGALVAYILIFERIGFVTATTALLAFLFGALGRYRWPVAVGGALLVAFAARLVFDRWLQVRLPPDVWGR